MCAALLGLMLVCSTMTLRDRRGGRRRVGLAQRGRSRRGAVEDDVEVARAGDLDAGDPGGRSAHERLGDRAAAVGASGRARSTPAWPGRRARVGRPGERDLSSGVPSASAAAARSAPGKFPPGLPSRSRILLSRARHYRRPRPRGGERLRSGGAGQDGLGGADEARRGDRLDPIHVRGVGVGGGIVEGVGGRGLGIAEGGDPHRVDAHRSRAPTRTRTTSKPTRSRSPASPRSRDARLRVQGHVEGEHSKG